MPLFHFCVEEFCEAAQRHEMRFGTFLVEFPGTQKAQLQVIFGCRKILSCLPKSLAWVPEWSEWTLTVLTCETSIQVIHQHLPSPQTPSWPQIDQENLSGQFFRSSRQSLRCFWFETRWLSMCCFAQVCPLVTQRSDFFFLVGYCSYNEMRNHPSILRSLSRISWTIGPQRMRLSSSTSDERPSLVRRHMLEQQFKCSPKTTILFRKKTTGKTQNQSVVMSQK